LWFVYRFDKIKEEKKNIIKIIEILQDITSHVYPFFIPEKKDNKIRINFKPKHIILPIKCYIDILNDYANFSKKRQNTIETKLSELISSETDDDTVFFNKYKNIMPDLAASFNLGHISFIGKKVKFEDIRFDPVGLDVDLFFRCCKFSMPAMVCIGQKLFKSLNKPDMKSMFNFWYIRQRINKALMKGIFKDYTLYHMPSLYCDNYFQKNIRHDDGCDETRSILFENNFIVESDEYVDNMILYRRNTILWKI
jgi:hypothetical protein